MNLTIQKLNTDRHTMHRKITHDLLSFKAPAFGPTHNLPPSRSAHQSCVWNGYLYIFGGEYSSPNGEKFKLYEDMW
jgi:hypothetical protein